MADAVKVSYSPKPPHPSTFRGDVDADISVDDGAPVTFGSGVIFARANTAATANVAGLATSAAEEPGQVNIQYDGPLTLTTAQWDARTGQTGGLTPHTIYYLSAATAGHLTTTPPSGGNYVTPIGFALSETTMMLQIKRARPTLG